MNNPTEQDNPVCCNVCGKDMRTEKETVIGVSITLTGPEYMQEQMGPYTLGKTYNACYECMLKSYGFKP